MVEAAAIDLLGTTSLTNKVAGGHNGTFPRIEIGELVSIETAKPAKIRHDAMLITINQLYRSNMTPLELYEATRGVWRVGKNRENVELVMAVFQGIVREVYRPSRWIPAGTLDYETRSRTDVEVDGRWEFEGRVAEDVRNDYVGYSVGKGGQNPVRYVYA